MSWITCKESAKEFKPVSPLNTVTQKSNQIFVAHMADSLNFHSEFLLGLTTTQDANYNSFISDNGKEAKYKMWKTVAKDEPLLNLQIIEELLNCNGSPIDQMAMVNNSIPTFTKDVIL